MPFQFDMSISNDPDGENLKISGDENIPMQVKTVSGPNMGSGVSAQRPVGGEGQIDIGRALAARLVREKEVRRQNS